MTKIIHTEKSRPTDVCDVGQLPRPDCPVELIFSLKMLYSKEKAE